jgi:hypothetical protein
VRALLPAAILVLASCQSSTPSTAHPAATCHAVTMPKPVATDPPVALLKDIAGPNDEYLLGVPGGRLQVLDWPIPAGAALTTGGVLYGLIPRTGQPDIHIADRSGCRRIADGTLYAVAPGGAEMVRTVGATTSVIDAKGNEVATLPRAQYMWTAGGRLVGMATTGGTVYDASFKPISNFPVVGVLLGPSGPSGVLIDNGVETKLVNTDSLATTSLKGHPRPVSGSPDGRYMAGYDATSNTCELFTSETDSVPLDCPGPPFSFLWSPDSAWLAINTLFGAKVVHISDQITIDAASNNVVSW